MQSAGPPRTGQGRSSGPRGGRRAGRPRGEHEAVGDPGEVGPHRGFRVGGPGGHGRHRVRDLLGAAAGPARLGADRLPRGAGVAPLDRRPGRGPVPRRGLLGARHPGEPPPGPGGTHLGPAPARVERRPGDAGGPLRRLRGRPPRGGRAARRHRRLRQPRRRGHLRRPGGGGGRGRGHGGRQPRVGGLRRPVGHPLRLLDGPLAAPGRHRRPARRTGRAVGGRHRRLPVDGPGARSRGPGLRRLRRVPGRFPHLGPDRGQHGPRRGHHRGGGGRPEAGAMSGAPAIPADWASAIGPVRGSCLPSMRGYHVLDIADLLTPENEGPR